MKITDIREGAVKDEIIGVVTELSPPKSAKNGSQFAVGTLSDESGHIKFTVWENDVNRVKRGDKISVVKGFASTYKGELGFSAGQYGQIEVLEGSQEAPATQKKTEPAKTAGGRKLDHYYGGVKELRECEVKDANILLAQGWLLEGIKERHVTQPTPNGLSHDSAIIYVLSRREN